MAFNGIYPAAPLKPTEFGILSAARVTTHTSRAYDERWVRGFSFEYDSRPTLRLLEDGGSAVHTMFDGTGLPRFIDVKPFFIEVEDFRSTFSLPGEDRFARVLRQLDAATQKAIERELENGYVRRVDSTTNQYLADASSLTYASATPATAESAARALSLLESALSNSPVGEQGIHHLTRDVAALLGANWLLDRIEDPDFQGKYHIETTTGTTVIIGSGYMGNGPVFTVSNKARATNTVTITTSAPHYLSTGETVVVSGVDAELNGTFTVASTPSDVTFTYAKNGTDIPSASATGTAQMQGSSTVNWVYSTGSVDVHIGKAEVVNDTLAQGYDVSGNQNDMRIKANRPAAVYFDPAMHYAVKVDLTA